MSFLVPIASLLATMSILFVFTVNRRANIARTIMCVIFPVLFVMFAWTDWSGWHTSSGNEAVQYSIAFVCMCVAFAATLIALGRRIGWLRHHHHDAWTGWSQ